MKKVSINKISIDITPYFKKERNRIKSELIKHIKSKWLDLEIDDDMEDEDITYLFTISYDYGEDEDNTDSIRFDLVTEDNINYFIESCYEMDEGTFRRIDTTEQLDEIIERLIDNVRKGLVSEVEDWMYSMEENNDEEFITRDISELDVDLN